MFWIGLKSKAFGEVLGRWFLRDVKKFILEEVRVVVVRLLFEGD